MKSKWMNVRMTPDEWAAVKKQADELGLSVSDFVRVRILVGVKENKKEYRKKNKKECRELAEEIARVGNNINQLARWANTYKSAADGAQAIRLFAMAVNELKKISAMVMGE